MADVTQNNKRGETAETLQDAPEFEYVFPAIRGIQAGQEYFVSMCPLRLIPRIFLFDEDELTPEVRAQRSLNKVRLPEIARYIVDNADSYVFSALTASIDGNLSFESAVADRPGGARLGTLHVPMTARFVINDGQHRRGAIELALQERPELADESIAIVFFRDQGLQRSQQMFADLNRHAVRPSKSIGVLYDNRDDLAIATRQFVLSSPLFRDIVEMERSTLAQRSRKLITLSAVYGATTSLLSGYEGDASVELMSNFWSAAADLFPEWQLVRDRRLSAGEVRQDFIHSHGTVLHALGRTGNALIHTGVNSQAGFAKRLQPLKRLDWSRGNAELWEGRAIIGGRVSKATQNVLLTTSVLKKTIGIDLTPDEERVEEAFNRGGRGARGGK